MSKYILGIIGAGNMASAIIDGIIKKGSISTADIFVSDIDKQKLKSFADMGIAVTDDNSMIASSSRYVLLAIKPQVAPTILKGLDFSKTSCIISIMAGVKIDKLIELTANDTIARIMPNLPAAVGKGMSAYTFSKQVDSDIEDFVRSVFETVGVAQKVEECLFDAVTSISGSGPAYVFSFIDAMIKGGMEGGLDFETAKILTINTFLGGIEMVARSDKSISELITSVCSKGGTTIEAINTFRNKNLEGIIIEGIEKCRKRSEELG